jgi:hypothetical protein
MYKTSNLLNSKPELNQETQFSTIIMLKYEIEKENQSNNISRAKK